ncbi:hypothetical protein FPH17_05355 [Corynebacterium godavarianum]|uniref:Uncharacterized protein n=1 Tax=Corynebacterium godavarianum TaxID=2054421 RepID=A0ABY3E5H2_9CORY|nr:hypothetical protein [Corynebacterium godavarianum]MBL7284913.1 hypothetical protein [Corynebacterium godavarianum]TSJ74879.1 hypothetical protein FPH17_05355 [Corynebacterium godavarianum]
MQSPNYVVPDHGIGAVRSIPTCDVDQALVRNYLANARDGHADFQVTLLQRGEDAGFYITADGNILGTMAEHDALEYQELAHITEAGLTPEVTARAESLADGTVNLTLRLPRPGLCIPANEPPTEPWALLDGTGPRVVSYLPDAAERDMDDRMSLLVRLGFDEAGDVIACLGKGGVGTLDPRTASEITPTLRNLEQRGLIVVVRGYHAPTANGVELTVNLSGVDETGPPSEVSPVPFLPLPEAQRIPEFATVGAPNGASCGRPSLASGELTGGSTPLAPSPLLDEPAPAEPEVDPASREVAAATVAKDTQDADEPAGVVAAPTTLIGEPEESVTEPDQPRHRFPHFRADDDAEAAALAAEQTTDMPVTAVTEDTVKKPAAANRLHPACIAAGTLLILLTIAGVIAISTQWNGGNSAAARTSPASYDDTVVASAEDPQDPAVLDQ